jgi:hypothetical protein
MWDWATKLQPGGPLGCIPWVIGRKDLNPWADLRFVANRDLHDVEDNAVEVQEHARTETDVEAVVAVKRRPNHGTLANRSEASQQQFPPLRVWRAKRRVVAGEPFMGAPGPLPCGRAHLFAVDRDTPITSVKPTPQMVQRR